MQIEQLFNLYKKERPDALPYRDTRYSAALVLIQLNHAVGIYLETGLTGDIAGRIGIAQRLLSSGSIFALSETETFRRLGALGGKKCHRDNLPFKQAYRILRDSPENKGLLRSSIIDMIDMEYKAAPSSLETWAKEADKEDDFVRKAGRPRKKV